MSSDLLQTIFYCVGSGAFVYISLTYSRLFRLLKKENTSLRNRYISLDNEDFGCLVRGGVLTVVDASKGGVIKIALRDIGFDQMHLKINHAMSGQNTYAEHTKIINS